MLCDYFYTLKADRILLTGKLKKKRKMERFIEQYTNFCRELSSLLPRDVATIQAIREDLKEGATAQGVLTRFLGWVRPRVVALSAKNVEEFWGRGQGIAPGVDIAGRWDKFSEATQNSLWQWAQVLFVTASSVAPPSLEEFAETLEGLDQEELAANTTRILEELTRSIQERGEGGEGGEVNAPDFNPEEFEKMGKDLLEGTTLGSIAEEIIEEILSGKFKFGDVIKAMEAELENERDPAKIVAKLMSSRHKGKLMQLMRRLAQRLQEKLRSKNVSQDILMREAAMVMQKLQNTEILEKIKEMAGGAIPGMGRGGGAAAGGGARRMNKKKARKMQRKRQ